jgi:hypothetical protein
MIYKEGANGGQVMNIMKILSSFDGTPEAQKQ